MTLRAAAALAVGVIAGCAQADPQGLRAVEIEATPIALGPMQLDGLDLEGAWVLRSDDPDFGGISGLLVDGDGLTAITDRGVMLRAAIARQGEMLDISGATMRPLTDRSGRRIEEAGSDAEGLAQLGERMLISFERDHRIAPVTTDARTGPDIRLRSFESLPFNAGLEALAVAQGTLLAIGEEETSGPGGRGFPVFAFDADGRLLAETRLPARTQHAMTGADIGPDGRLYTVQRFFSVATGVSIRVVRYDLAGTPPLPVAESASELGAFEARSGLDNMEALAIAQGSDGDPRLWVISDDNFNALQRTLLIEFRIAP